VHRAAHALGQFVAIIVVVVSGPVVAVRAGAGLGGVGPVPHWWDRAFTIAVPSLVVAVAFLVWEARRISRRETEGIVVNRLRVPAPRRHR